MLMRVAYVVAAMLAASSAQAESEPVVVELFTSQSCSSCPPAEAYLAELAEKPGIIALEWHVSYWNDLVHGRAGRWVDPFSSPANTDRQRAYVRALGKADYVYTPQMVVAGNREAVGSDRSAVEAHIARSRKAGYPLSARIISGNPDGGALRVQIDGPPSEATLWLVTYQDRRTTEIRGGENQGRRLDNHHVVTGLVPIGRHVAGASSFTVPRPRPGEGCAVLVQNDSLGPILGAAACPTPDAGRR